LPCVAALCLPATPGHLTHPQTAALPGEEARYTPGAPARDACPTEGGTSSRRIAAGAARAVRSRAAIAPAGRKVGGWGALTAHGGLPPPTAPRGGPGDLSHFTEHRARQRPDQRRGRADPAHPRLAEANRFSVGTQINGAPHLGTSIVQALTFAMAARVRERFGIPVEVLFGALDNAPYAIVADEASGHRYQRAYAHAFGQAALVEQVGALYLPLFDAMSEHLDVPYTVETYSRQQATERFRATWLRVLTRIDGARWWLAPSTGVPHVRVPCPRPGCGWAEKYAERTVVRRVNAGQARVKAVCLHHGPYEVTIEPGAHRGTSTSPPCTGTS
jgi:hypothetical protein